MNENITASVLFYAMYRIWLHYSIMLDIFQYTQLFSNIINVLFVLIIILGAKFAFNIKFLSLRSKRKYKFYVLDILSCVMIGLILANIFFAYSLAGYL